MDSTVRVILVTTLCIIAACATPKPESNRSESVQATESAGDEMQVSDESLASNKPAESIEGIEDIEAPNASETPAAMIPHAPMAEPEIICDREIPTGSHLPVEVCRRRADIEQRREADQRIFDRIKQNTAIGASRL